MEDKLIVENQNLIYYVLKQMRLYHKRDEYFDLGLIGLVKGVKTYNPESDNALATYLVNCIRNEILMELRKEKALKRKSNEALELSYTCEFNDDLTLIDAIDAGVNVELECFKSMDTELLREKLNILDDRERMVIYYNFGLYGCPKLTQYEIADKLGITRSLVSKIKRQAIEKLRKELS